MDLAKHRLVNQHLVGAKLGTPEAVVRWLGAVQAQDFAGATWGLAQRTAGADAAAVERAFDAGAFVRTHVLRPTWHLVPPEDVRWMLALTAPRVKATLAHYDRRLELDAATLRRSHDLIAVSLRDGRYRTRMELADVLERAGIAARGQRLGHLMMHAELDALVCSGPRRGKQQTYALLDERVAPAPPLTRDEALATLARRYFASHGPATAHDFAWWSGLKVSDARAGLGLLAPEVEQATVDGKTYWTAAPVTPVEVEEPVVHLLPNYDEHVVAYRDRGPSCAPEARGALHVRGGLDAHLVALNGLVVGGWRRSVGRTGVVVKPDLLVALRRSERAALARAAEDYSRFLGLPVALEGA